MKLLLTFAISIAAFAAANLPACSADEVISGIGNQLQLTSCNQSSHFKGSLCSNAISNKDTQNVYVEHRCAVGEKERDWWSAKTVMRAHIRTIRVVNREECCRERLNDFTISVDGVECVRHKSNVTFLDKTFSCNAVGQEIKISSNLDSLTLCKVEAFGEYIDQLQLTSCNQSSHFKGSLCSNAISNTYTPNAYVEQRCAVGEKERDWWSAKTVMRAHIRNIAVANREDCCRDNLNDFTISVDGVECVRHKSNVTFLKKSFACDAVGQEIKISSNLPLLTLCKVEVYGIYVDQLHLTNCNQSSHFKGSLCSNAIISRYTPNAYVEQRCAVGEKERDWWSAKTVMRAQIRTIRIVNREDCCRERLNDFTISVDGVECVRHKSNVTFLEKFFNCGAIGKEIKISSNLDYLTLCKVEVFGENVNELR